MDIHVWPATAPGSVLTHFWYKAADHRYRHVCDDAPWPDAPLMTDGTSAYSPCLECREIYVEDIVHGGERFRVDLIPACCSVKGVMPSCQETPGLPHQCNRRGFTEPAESDE